MLANNIVSHFRFVLTPKLKSRAIIETLGWHVLGCYCNLYLNLETSACTAGHRYLVERADLFRCLAKKKKEP